MRVGIGFAKLERADRNCEHERERPKRICARQQRERQDPDLQDRYRPIKNGRKHKWQIEQQIEKSDKVVRQRPQDGSPRI
jgi:hypothetical protein